MAHETGIVLVPPVQLSGFRDGRHDFSRHAKAITAMVPGYVVHRESEVWSERSGPAKGLGIQQVRDSLDLAA